MNKGCFGLIWLFTFALSVFTFVVSIMGVYHAFQASIILGIISILGMGSVTPVIELVDWFSYKELWVEIAKLLGV